MPKWGVIFQEKDTLCGIRLEVRLEKDLVKNKVRAVAGRVMY